MATLSAERPGEICGGAAVENFALAHQVDLVAALGLVEIGRAPKHGDVVLVAERLDDLP